MYENGIRHRLQIRAIGTEILLCFSSLLTKIRTVWLLATYILNLFMVVTFATYCPFSLNFCFALFMGWSILKFIENEFFMFWFSVNVPMWNTAHYREQLKFYPVFYSCFFTIFLELCVTWSIISQCCNFIMKKIV